MLTLPHWPLWVWALGAMFIVTCAVIDAAYRVSKTAERRIAHVTTTIRAKAEALDHEADTFQFSLSEGVRRSAYHQLANRLRELTAKLDEGIKNG